MGRARNDVEDVERLNPNKAEDDLRVVVIVEEKERQYQGQSSNTEHSMVEKSANSISSVAEEHGVKLLLEVGFFQTISIEKKEYRQENWPQCDDNQE